MKVLDMTGVVFRKELASFFNSAVAYIIIVVFLGLTGWFTFSTFFINKIATLDKFFSVAPWILLFIVPAITMRQLSEERKSGTIELLVTKPVSDWGIVAGKFLASWALILIALVPTFLYWLTAGALGDMDNGPVLTAYFGLLLMSGVNIAVGLLASSFTKNQVVAFIIALIINLLLFLMGYFLLFMPPLIVSTMEFIGTSYHYSNMSRGVIDSRDIIYFASIGGIALYASVLSLGRRKW